MPIGTTLAERLIDTYADLADSVNLRYHPGARSTFCPTLWDRAVSATRKAHSKISGAEVAEAHRLARAMFAHGGCQPDLERYRHEAERSARRVVRSDAPFGEAV